MRYPCQGTYVDGNGKVVADGTVVIYEHSTTTVITMYAAETGGTAVTSATTDDYGAFTLWVEGTDYAGTDPDWQLFDVTLSKDGYETQTYVTMICPSRP